MSLIGIHISNINHIITKSNKQIKLFQLFINPLQNYSDEKYKILFNHIHNNNVKLCIHASYSINLSKSWKTHDWWIQQLIAEILNANKLNAFCVTIHTGKQLDYSNSVAINNMYTSLLYVLSQTHNHINLKILIETPSGQGTETLVNINTFCDFIKKFESTPYKDIMGICLDTCHIYSAGYDITNENILNEYFSIIDKTVGINKIKLCHLNNSKTELNSKIDRHANLTDGTIDVGIMKKITKFIIKLGIPIVLETPTKNIYNDYSLINNFQ